MEAAKRAGVEGDHFAFREALVDGPTPAGLDDEQWIEIRTAHLAGTYGEDRDQIREFLTEELAMLEDVCDEEELLLWFDQDLFCQVNLMFIVARLFEDGCQASLTLVESHHGDEESLDHSIRHLSPEEQETYARAWKAWGSEDPAAMEQVLEGDLSEALRGAIELHRKRFPSALNGLGQPDQRLLEILDSADAPDNFGDLFVRFSNEEPGYGLGDAQVWSRLAALASDPEPLITIEAGEEGRPEQAKVRITEPGVRVLGGGTDAVAMRGIDRWLGGVHLTPDKLWRWSEGRLIRDGSVEAENAG